MNKKRLTPAERAYIQRDANELVNPKPSWLSLLRHRATWAFVLTKFLTDPIFWFYLYWLPKFLNKQYGLTITSSIGPLVFIYTIVAIGGTMGGWASSWLLQNGWSVNRSRKTVMLVSALLITPIVGAAFTQNVWLAVCLIALSAAAHQSWSTVLFTTVSDQFPKQGVASVVGVGGMAGAVGGMLIATATGYLLEATGSYLPIFILAASVYLIALGLFQLLNKEIGVSTPTSQSER